MANPGGAGNKFVSVNLNKSYGHVSQPNHHHQSSNVYGSGRSRYGGGSGGGGGGSGMVVLSRPRSSNKTGTKLSVPPPLNLPSLRKEHEKFDVTSSGGSVGGSGIGGAVRPNSSGSGWSKLGGVTSSLDRERVGASRPLSSDGAKSGLLTSENTVKGSENSAYLPPSARLGVVGSDAPVPVQAEKTSVLRGEDFPSLQATLTGAANGPSQKQKDAQKQRVGNNEESNGAQKEGSKLSSLTDMHSKEQHSQHSIVNGLEGCNSEIRGSDNSQTLNQGRKQEDYFSGPLPLVRLSPRSDWADDERDTGNSFLDRDRDNGHTRTEMYWDREFDLPRSSMLPNKPIPNGKPFTEIPKTNIHTSDTRIPSREGREGNSWRSSVPRAGMTLHEAPRDKSEFGVKTAMNEQLRRDNKYAPPLFGGNAGDDVSNGLYGRRDAGYRHGGRQQWSSSGGTLYGQAAERNVQDRYSSVSSRYKSDHVQNNLVPKSSVSYNSRGLPLNDPLLNFGREKRSFPRGEKPYVEDWGSLVFDGMDPLSGGLGVVKRKKDINKEVDFHDPIRESFEAELERVQKLQELERKRIIEEQERALEMARREEEERQRLAREQEEHLRKLEEEAREAAWRAEQDRLEAEQRAEEQRVAREEEKQRILMEEERRKQAAKQKLQELEERIARRAAQAANPHTSSAVADEKVPEAFKGKDTPREEDRGWEDTDRMVQRITNSSSSDSSSLNRSFDVSGARSITDAPLSFRERGKPLSSWRRDPFDNENDSSFFSMDQDSGHHSLRRDGAFSGRPSVHNDFAAGAGYTPSRGQYRAGMSEPNVDDLFHPKGSRWSVSRDGDHFDIAEKFGDMGWGNNHPRGSFNSPYAERGLQNVEQDELYPYSRSRYSSRQPRVLPPPSFPSLHSGPFRSENQHGGSAAHEEVSRQYYLPQPVAADPVHGHIGSERRELSDVFDHHDDCANTKVQTLNADQAPRCDSQSSLSVSSPPTSPTHLSHDDFDESGNAGVISVLEDTTQISMSGNESLLLNSKIENVVAASSSICLGDDEEWNSENDLELQEQEEYDEDEVYEEDEVHGEDESVSLNKEFEGIHLEEKDADHVNENVILGFDQGVEVRMPNDEYERSPRNEKISYVAPQVSGGIILGQESFESRGHDGHSLQFAENALHANAKSYAAAQQTGKEIGDMVIQSIASSSSAQSTDLLNPVDPSSGSVISASPSVPPPKVHPHLSGQMVTSTVAAAENHPEVPVKLQFGLFSGPSLIPSPVPSIQIGSIQMPLQMHPHFGPSLANMNPSPAPMFQFGQIRYPSPISQGLLPLGPHSMAFVQPNVPHSYPLNHNVGGHFSAQPHEESPAHFAKDHSAAQSGNNSHVYQKQSSFDHSTSKEASLPFSEQSGESDVLLHRGPTEAVAASANQARLEGNHSTVNLNHKRTQYEVHKELSAVRSSAAPPNSQSEPHIESAYGARDGWTAHGQFPGSSNNRNFAFINRNPGQRMFPPASLRSDSNGFKRKARRDSVQMEFRVRQSGDRRQSSHLDSTNSSFRDSAYTSYNSNRKDRGLLPKGSIRREKVVKRPNRIDEPGIHTSDQFKSQETGSQVKSSKGLGEEAPRVGSDVSHHGDESLKRNISAEDDVDAPVQSGIVRVFKQPGIEAPSDEDDFIEVRSKRQMLNDRREQREKENKAKLSSMKKASRRSQSVAQGAVEMKITKKATTSSTVEVRNVTRAGHMQNRGLISNEVSGGPKSMVWQPLAPIGTPSAGSHAQDNAKSQTVKSLQGMTRPAAGQPAQPGLLLDAEHDVQDNAQTSVGSWGHSLSNQQVMPLTQTQLDEAMQPARYELPDSVNEPSIPSSTLAKDVAFSTAASPINSLLAGEKIQFGAVTSPTILPSSSRSVSHGIGPPGPNQPDLRVSRKISDSKNEFALHFEKDKQPKDSCLHLEEAQAEAEAAAAASAVAAAAISSDEVAVTRLDTCPATIVNTDVTGTASMQDAASQSKGEETLAVSLPADLSVDTPPISLWPPLPSPQASSGQMLSPFSGSAPSHFPFYDMNPMIGGPIIAFGPPGESSQPQPQQSSASGSGPLGSWQQSHSGADSFYGPPAGFTGPFINPSGNISGVQGHPHMVVYNHFAPVGQFGQVGLSYMGSTFIPSGKQPDWKHNPATGGGDGDATNPNVASMHRNPPSMPPLPVQHLAPGSRLLSMPQPFMFDVSPFQSTSEMPLQGRWTHIPHPPLHSMNQPTAPLQQQAGGAMPTQFNQGSASDNHPPGANMLPKAQSAPAESVDSFPGSTDLAAGQFPAELGLVDAPNSVDGQPSTHVTASNGFPGDRVENAAERSDAGAPINGSKRIPQFSAGASYKNQTSSHHRHSSGQQYHHPSSYSHPRGSGTEARNGPGSDWTHRRMGFQRNHSAGNDRGFPPAKMKQIYVAKQTAGGTSAV